MWPRPGVLFRLFALAHVGGAAQRPPLSLKFYNFTTKVDHFTYSNNDTFQLRYAMSDEHWNKSGGPIFFYAGNESPVETFIYNTGIMWEWAPEFKALVVFGEHRYQGTSLPFGNDSFKGPEYTGYLTSEQALADYADLLTWLKNNLPGAKTSKVVAFGGSYGALLSTWFRIKYPHIIDAVLASSTPVRMFPGLHQCGVYFEATTTAYEKSSPGCSKLVSKTWPVLDQFGSTEDGRQTLQEKFQLCEALNESSYLDFRDWVRDTYTFLAMVNYPFSANLIGELPAFPVKAACNLLRNQPAEGEAAVDGSAKVMNLFYNSSGNRPCMDIHLVSKQLAWNFQECTEIIWPTCSDGIHDMFYPREWNAEEYVTGCQERFGVTPEFDKITTTYPVPELQTASNIVFTDGDLDPWASFGLKKAPNKNTKYILIEGAAHHVDLQFSRPDDPRSFKNARNAAKKAIWGWIS